jgi:hypothetical protein
VRAAPGPVGFQNSAIGAACASGGAFVLADQPSENRSAPDPLVLEIQGGMIGASRAKLKCSMWPPAVVVSAVLGEDGPQVAFAEDEDAVGEFGSGGQDEAFGEAVRSRASRWDLHGVDAGAGQDGVERCGPPRKFRTSVMGLSYAANCSFRNSLWTSLGVR